ncbi:MFS transporter [Burkholderia plantarii]|uniref:MFS transporter n=1 Tax=Burkholderia plantarii TaxID=41899 RepID=UPI000AE67D4A|nr:MFS transporter [Burkholderia plantarii]
MTNSITVLLICRVLQGIGEGIYWPQQSRFATAWFAPNERTKANAVIQYYGQFLALAIGFMLLTPLYDASGRRALFYIAGRLGLLVIVPLYLAMLKPQSEARYPPPKRGSIASKLMPGALAARPMARRAASPSARQPLPRGFAFPALPIAIRSRRGHRSHGRYPPERADQIRELLALARFPNVFVKLVAGAPYRSFPPLRFAFSVNDHGCAIICC